MRKIRVLHIIKSLGRGGAEMLLPETLKVHNKSAFDFRYLYFLPWKDQVVGQIRDAGGTVVCFPASNNIRLLLKAMAVSRYVRKEGIDLIHAHLPWAGILARIAGKLTEVPVVYTEHNLQERYHPLTRWANRVTFNQQATVIAVSGEVSDSIRKKIGNRTTVKEILNGVNVDYFARNDSGKNQLLSSLGIPANAVVVGTAAVFRTQKALDRWLMLFRKVADKHEHCYGLLIGDGPLMDSLKSLRKELNLEDRVIMPGLQTDVRPFLSVIDIYLMTSIFEGLPLALLEAMSMRCAICATTAGGIGEVIQNGKEGYLVPVSEWEMLAQKLDVLITDSGLRKEMGAMARNKVVNEFSMERMVAELEQVYMDVYKNKSGY